MILISLEDISARGVPDALATDPAFESDRQAIRALVAKGRQEAESENQVSIETLRKLPRGGQGRCRTRSTPRSPRGPAQRDEADNFLKALYGLSKMLETARPSSSSSRA